MNRRRSLILLVIAVIGLLLSPLVIDAVSNRVRVLNASQQQIKDLRIKVWSQELGREEIPPGRSVGFRFRTEYGDSGLTVTARLKDGTLLEQTDGYVTGGDPFRVERFTVTIHPDKIAIRQNE